MYDDCSYTKYSLQLSVYAYMLERQGYVIDGLHLVHIFEDKIETYDIGYLKEDVMRLMQ